MDKKIPHESLRLMGQWQIKLVNLYLISILHIFQNSLYFSNVLFASVPAANAVWNTAKNVAHKLVNEHKTRVNVYDTVQKGFPGVKSSNARKATGFALDSQGLDHDNNVANFLKEEGLQKCYNYLVKMNENLQNARVSSAKKEAVQSVVDNWNSLSDADKVYLLRQISKNPMIRKVVNSKDYQW